LLTSNSLVGSEVSKVYHIKVRNLLEVR